MVPASVVVVGVEAGRVWKTGGGGQGLREDGKDEKDRKDWKDGETAWLLTVACSLQVAHYVQMYVCMYVGRLDARNHNP